MRIRWHPRAVEDLEEIKRFIAQDSPKYAYAVVASLLSVVKSAARQPMLGRVVPEIGNPDIRERIHRNYRIIYRTKPQFIEVIAVRHGARESQNIIA
jgi:plasmid stabilization system protein ParE